MVKGANGILDRSSDWYAHQCDVRVVDLQSFEEDTNIVDVESFRTDGGPWRSSLDQQDEVIIVECQNIGRQMLSKNDDGESWSVGKSESER